MRAVKTELFLMNMHIHIWTLVGGKDKGDSEVCWAPLGAFSPVLYKETDFPVRPRQGRHGGKLEHP